MMRYNTTGLSTASPEMEGMNLEFDWWRYQRLDLGEDMFCRSVYCNVCTSTQSILPWAV